MATELYSTGIHRLIYQTVGFVEGVTVTGYIIDPDLVKSAEQTFTEIESGLYYLDYNFSQGGVFATLIYEGGVITKSGTYRVYAYPGIVTYRQRE